MTGAGRVRYAMDPGAKRVWVTRASPGHTPETDWKGPRGLRGSVRKVGQPALVVAELR